MESYNNVPSGVSLNRVRVDFGSFRGFDSFADAAKSVIQFLKTNIGLDLWMVTRVDGNEWLVLDVSESSYNRHAHDVLAWDESVCYRMVSQEGPNIAPDVAAIEAYRTAPIVIRDGVGAYIGVPILFPNGEIFGTLCGISPEVQPPTLAGQLELIVLQARLLSTVLALEIERAEVERVVDSLEFQALGATATGMLDFDVWHLSMVREDERSARLGAPALVMLFNFHRSASMYDQARLRSFASTAKAAADPRAVLGLLPDGRVGLFLAELSHGSRRNIAGAIADSLVAAGFDYESSFLIKNGSESLLEVFNRLYRA